MNLEYNVQSKFQVIEGPLQQLPHRCAGCGRYETADNKFIDFNLEIEFYGKVFICLETCLVEMANQMGYASSQQWENMQIESGKLLLKYNELYEENKELKNALASFRVVFGNNLTVTEPPSVVFAPTGESPETKHRLDESEPEESNEDESGSNEQTDESGSSDVSSDDSLQQFLRTDI